MGSGGGGSNHDDAHNFGNLRFACPASRSAILGLFDLCLVRRVDSCKLIFDFFFGVVMPNFVGMGARGVLGR